MANILSGSEVLEMAVQIERNGKDFYNTLVIQSQNPDFKRVFKFLGAEEDKHILVFQKMLDAAAKYDPAESFPGEYFAYLRALAGDHVFTQKGKGQEIAKNIKSDREAVILGIGFEKDSIVFYDGLRKVVPDHDHKILDAIIAQERNHLKQLIDLNAAP